MMIWSFLKECFGRFVWVWLFVMILGIWLMFAPSPFAQEAGNKVYVLQLNDEMISPVTADFIQKGINKAQEDHAQALVIELDTPGGMLGATHTIIKSLLNAPLPVVVYVAPEGARAGSAGVFITEAAHIAAMAPNTHIGAAHPVDVNGSWPINKGEQASPDQDVMSQKILNDVTATMRGLATSHDRNADWAVKAVTQSATMTSSEAVQNRVVDLSAVSIHDLLNKLDGKTVLVQGQPVTLHLSQAEVVNEEFSLRQKTLSVLTHPLLAYILLMIGFYGLLFEVTHPGFALPGIVGVICLVLALSAMQAMSINLAGLGLIILAIMMFIGEVFSPSFGVLFGGGVICLLLGTLFLYQSDEPYLKQATPYLMTTAAALACVAGLLVYKISKVMHKKAVGPINRLIGQLGEVLTPIAPDKKGKIQVYGEIWDAESEEPLAAKDPVQVVAINPMNSRVLKVVKFVEES